MHACQKAVPDFSLSLSISSLYHRLLSFSIAPPPSPDHSPLHPTPRIALHPLLSTITKPISHTIQCHNQPIYQEAMTRGAWRMLAMLAVLVLIAFLSVGSVDAQGTPCKQAGGVDCGSHATCYTSERGSFCECNSFYTGNGINCKYSTWRVVVYILGSIIAFVLMFYLCISCFGYKRNQAQLSSYPMEPTGHPAHPHPAYGYPSSAGQSSANPAMFSYPPHHGFPLQTGYPVTAFPPHVVTPPTSKVPGPSGTTT